MDIKLCEVYVMTEVMCGNCEHYLYYKERGERLEALCDFCGRRVSAFDKVCEEFIIMQGLFTKRTIPDYCKYYKKSEG